MRIEGDYAIIETAEEAAVFTSDIKIKPCIRVTAYPFAENMILTYASKPLPFQVLEAITPKDGDAVFGVDPSLFSNSSPSYFMEWGGTGNPNLVTVNALTIGKTIGQLRDLLKWAAK